MIILKKISSYDKLNKLEIYKFDYDLSTIQETLYGHISEATYYRLFRNTCPIILIIFLYVDADIICYRDPIPLIKEEIKKLSKSEHYFQLELKFLERKKLSLTGKDWDLKVIGILMPGVLCINYKEWLKKDMLKNSSGQNEYEKDILLYWDQDLMNMVIDDKYVELNNMLNFDLFMAPDNVNLSLSDHYGQDALNNMSLLHFTGSMKPWTIRAAFNKRAIFT